MISAREIFEIIIMSLAVGYIFMDLFRLKARITHGFPWRDLGFAALVTAPALIAHELAHKFVAIASGLQATFHAAYMWLGLGVLLKLLHAPFIFFIPGYVSIGCASAPCNPEPLTLALVAFAGPALNLALWITSTLALRSKNKHSKKWFVFWYVTQRINLFLFILNMLPIPGFDGFKVYTGLWQYFA